MEDVAERRVNVQQLSVLAQFRRHVNRGKLSSGKRRGNGYNINQTVSPGARVADAQTLAGLG